MELCINIDTHCVLLTASKLIHPPAGPGWGTPLDLARVPPPQVWTDRHVLKHILPVVLRTRSLNMSVVSGSGCNRTFSIDVNQNSDLEKLPVVAS